MREVESLKIFTLIGSFCPKYAKFRWKSTDELCIMALKIDAKFEEKDCACIKIHQIPYVIFGTKSQLTLGSKNNTRNLVNFNPSSSKSENFHFDVLLLSIACKVSAKKGQKNYLSWHWKKIQNFEEKLTLYFKSGMRNLVNFNLSSGESENLHFDGLLL